MDLFENFDDTEQIQSPDKDKKFKWFEIPFIVPLGNVLVVYIKTAILMRYRKMDNNREVKNERNDPTPLWMKRVPKIEASFFMIDIISVTSATIFVWPFASNCIIIDVTVLDP